MKDSIKRFVGRAAAVVSALSFAISSMAFPASAAMVTPDASTIAGWLGSEIQCQYLTSSGTYQRDSLHLLTGVSFQDVSSGTWTGITHQYSSSPFDLIGTKVIWYYFSPPQDMASSNSDYTSPLLMVNWDIYFSNCSYIEAFTSSFVSAGFYNSAKYSIQKPYNYTELGSDLSFPSSYKYMYSQPSSDQNKPAWHSASTIFYNTNVSGGSFSGSSDTVYVGWASCSGLFMWNGLYVVGFSMPLLDDSAVYRGHQSQIYHASGTASGSMSENSSGGYDVDYDITLELPDYSGQLDIIANPELTPEQSGALSGLDSVGEAVGEAVDDYDEVIDDIDNYEWEIDGDSFALDSIDGDLPDLTPPSGVIDGVNDLWDLLELDRSAPIIIRYIPIFIIFAFGSYVIYGKWV